MNGKSLPDMILDFLAGEGFYGSVIIILITALILRVIKQYLIKKVAYSGKDEQHKNTFVGVIFSVMQYIVILTAVVLILHLNGINVVSILAGLGIAATIVGLALQDTLKDIISGINIYNNNFYKVGDMVRYNGEECDVSYFSARVTKFRSITTNSTYTVCNSAIRSIEKIKDQRVMNFVLPFSYEKEQVDAVCAAIMERARENIKDLKKIVYAGIVNHGREGMTYALVYSCPAHKAFIVKCQLETFVYEEFKKAGMMPYSNLTHLDGKIIWNSDM
ncbi:MAG: mechanosensitive ion channel family protein [Erysipelotrichaceae bacterium]|nr:mechanosensitive ion channel family protein [Erysipelotrichaceae bacterium]